MFAESSARLPLFEPPLPVRWYLPPAGRPHGSARAQRDPDRLRVQGLAVLVLASEATRLVLPEPLRDAERVADRIAFFNERVDTEVDGALLERPVTPWSKR